MSRLFGLVLVLAIAGGCATEGDAPPWRRPGLADGQLAGALQKAVKDTDNEMKMQADRPASQRDTQPRMPTPPDF
jgi:hypothetical protein